VQLASCELQWLNFNIKNNNNLQNVTKRFLQKNIKDNFGEFLPQKKHFIQV
jgi:hypothetical protein